MIKPSNLVFKDLRNSKRTTTMVAQSVNKDLITSIKDIKNVRSTKQIDITNFMENKNEKIRNIDVKLDVHQSEISRNNHIIEELNSNFLNLRVHLDREKEATINEERKNKLLRDEIDRTNKILRVKNSRIEDFNKKMVDIEKDNDSYRGMIGKYDEYVKTINTLRSKATQHEETVSDLRSALGEKDRELHRQKDKMAHYDSLKLREDDLNGQILMKDVTIGNLKQTLNELHQEKNRESSIKNTYERKVQTLNDQIEVLKTTQKGLNSTIAEAEKKYLLSKNKYEELESQLKAGDGRLKTKEQDEQQLRREHSELKQKLERMEGELLETGKKCSKRETKIDKLNQKVKELEDNCGDNFKEKEKIKVFEQKFGALKRKGESLQGIFYSIVPQIQCPFGHELQNPVTIIPCGHNYCLGCKKGYAKECMLCTGKLKIEAVYRNELMDDIIGMVGGIKQVIELLK